MRRPFLSLSLFAHAALLVLLHFYGGYQSDLRVNAEVASSLRATTMASVSKRIEDLQTIKQLLEKSSSPVDVESTLSTDGSVPPQTLEDVLERAREVSQEIDTIDRDIQENELAELLDAPLPPSSDPVTLPHFPDAAPMVADQDSLDRPEESEDQAPITDVVVDREVAVLEAKARATLKRRQERLEAKKNGVLVEGAKSGSSKQDADGKASVLAEIGAFIGAESKGPEIPSTGYSDENFFDGENSEIPAVDVNSQVLGRGRMFGAGGEYADRVYLNSWYIIGPFQGIHGNSLFANPSHPPSYPPEKAVMLDAVYFGKDKRLVRWRYVNAYSYPLTPPDFSEDSVYYGYTEVVVDEACDLTAWIGADDDVQVYLNDKLVWKGGNVTNKMPFFNTIYRTNNTYLHDYNRTEGKRALHFKKGRNKIFFKYSNGKSGGFISLVLTR